MLIECIGYGGERQGDEKAGGIARRLRKGTRSQVVWEIQVLTPRVAWLRERHHNSNFFWVRIPLEIRNSARGEKVFSVAEASVQSSLKISSTAIIHLRECGLILPFITKKITRPRIDYVALQQTYRRMLDDGPFTTQTDLARHLGVSSAWVAKVMR